VLLAVAIAARHVTIFGFQFDRTPPKSGKFTIPKSTLTIEKLLDVNSPKLFAAVANRTSFKKAVLTATEDSTQETITCIDASITKWSQDASQDQTDASLNFVETFTVDCDSLQVATQHGEAL
jgi:type VI protein secretion system component Hcp